VLRVSRPSPALSPSVGSRAAREEEDWQAEVTRVQSAWAALHEDRDAAKSVAVLGAHAEIARLRELVGYWERSHAAALCRLAGVPSPASEEGERCE
jgi:hypothetical protein